MIEYLISQQKETDLTLELSRVGMGNRVSKV